MFRGRIGHTIRRTDSRTLANCIAREHDVVVLPLRNLSKPLTRLTPEYTYRHHLSLLCKSHKFQSVDTLQVKQSFPTTEDPLESRLVKDILKCRGQEFNFFCHGEGLDASEIRYDLCVLHKVASTISSGHCRTFSIMTEKSKPSIVFRGGHFRVLRSFHDNNLSSKPYSLRMSSEMHTDCDTMIFNAIGTFL